MDYRRLIPNMCTSSNLVFGMCSILSTYSGNLVWGSIFILLALVADGLDGRTARFRNSITKNAILAENSIKTM